MADRDARAGGGPAPGGGSRRDSSAAFADRQANTGIRVSARELTVALGGRWQGRHGRAPCPLCGGKLQLTDGEVGPLLWCFGTGCGFVAITHELRRSGLWPAAGAAPRRAFTLRPPPGRALQKPTGAPWRLWRDCQRVEPGTVAAAYLAHRGCARPHAESDLRWHPALPHPSGWRGPALVALVTDAETGEPMTLHRTWLAAAGRGKAPIEKPRLLWPGLPKAGGVIRLWPDAEVTLGLAIAEGVETALAAARGFPAIWSTLDAGNLGDLPVLPGIEALTIIADHDKAGLAAAETCAARWGAAGIEVRIWHATEPGQDLADWATSDAQ